MAQNAKKKQETFQNAMLWFLDADPLPQNWEQFRTSRPAYFAGKVPTREGYDLQWIELRENDRCVPISVDTIYSHLAAVCLRMYPDERITAQKIRDLFFVINATLKTPYAEMTRHRILLDEPIKPIAFNDETRPCFERIDCPRPCGDRKIEPGNVDYEKLLPYWFFLLNRMEDYDEATGQSAFFEMFCMCLAEAFTGTSAPKVVPYIVGPRDSGKTTLMTDIGSLFGDAFAPDQKITRITHEYYVAELKGKRFVHCDEAPKGDHMSDEFKALTGGSEMLSGRSPASRPESFVNSVMLWITSNNEPLWGKDEAAKSRYRLIRINSLASNLRNPDANKRRETMRRGLGEVLEIGLGLIAHYGCIPESPESLISDAIEEENEEIFYSVRNNFNYKRGSMVDGGAVRAWAKSKGHNLDRVIECLKRLEPTVIEADAEIRLERQRTTKGRIRVWMNLIKFETPLPDSVAANLYK